MVFGNNIGPLSGTANLFYGANSNKSELKDLLKRLSDAIKQSCYKWLGGYRPFAVPQVQEVQSVLNQYEEYCKRNGNSKRKVLAELLTGDDSGLEEIICYLESLSNFQLGKDLNHLISQEPDSDYSCEDQKQLICSLIESQLKNEWLIGVFNVCVQLEHNPRKSEMYPEICAVIFSAPYVKHVASLLNCFSNNKIVPGEFLSSLLEQLRPVHLEQWDGLVDSLWKIWNFEHVDPQLREKIRHTVRVRLFSDEKTLFRFAREHQLLLWFLFKMGMRAPESSFSWGEVDRWPKSFRVISIMLVIFQIHATRFIADLFIKQRFSQH